MRKIILASASPRRRELLEQIGVSFEVCPSKGKEQTAETDPGAMVEELSLEKCLEVFSGMDQDCIVIGADTVVALDGKILGKPKDEEDAKRMLRMLSGKKHIVLSGYTIINKKYEISKTIKSIVYFNELNEEQIEEYIDKFKPLDKAGAYGIQDDYPLIHHIEGSYYNVMGLPIEDIERALKLISL